MNLHRSRRKEKRLLNHLLRKTQFGMYVEDCRGHPCVVTEQIYYTSDMYGWGFACESLVDGSPNSCSLAHCGPLPLSRDEAQERAAMIKQQGWDEYARRYGGYA